MRTKLLLILILSAFVMVFSTSPAAADGPFEVQDSNPAKALEVQGQNSGGNRLLVIADSSITEEMLEALRQLGKIHGVIDTFNIVAMSLRGNNSQSDIENLSFVVSVVEDQQLQFASACMWDRDIIDVCDVEESGGPPFDDPTIDEIIDDPRTVSETGDGVHVAVIDSGFPKNWRDFLDEDQVATNLAMAFTGGQTCEEKFVDTDKCKDGGTPTNQWERDTDGHGIAVASHITGFEVNGLVHEGVAPDATIIPLKVSRNENSTIWESTVIAALDYVTQLKKDGVIGPVVVNISIAGPVAIPFTEAAIDAAIAEGVIVVASAGNNGEGGMGFPGAFDQVISVGAIGSTEQFRSTSSIPEPNDNWWLFEDVPEADADVVDQVFVTPASSRELSGQHLDVLAPGENTITLVGAPQTERNYISGTSFSAPLVAGVAALILDKNGGLNQGQVESILKSSALGIPDSGSASIITRSGSTVNVSWDDCGGNCDAVGSGLVRADAALSATP